MPLPDPRQANRLFPAYLILAIPLIAGAFVSTGWSWGWDHLFRAGSVWRFLVLAAVALVWVPPIRGLIERSAVAAGGALGRHPMRLSILLSLAGLVLFAVFPIATRIYGDSRYILDDHTNGSLAVHVKRMLGFGLQSRGSASFVLHDLISRATGLSYERSYMAVSAICGGLFLFAHCRMAGGIPGISASARAIILWLGLTDGANQLFFGHVENYTVARLFACLFLIGLVRSLLDPEAPPRRLLTFAWLALAVFFHAQWLVLVPTAALWLGTDLARRRPALRPWLGRRSVLIGIGAALLACAIVYAAVGSYCHNYIYSGGRPHPRQLFLPISTACVGLPMLRYTLFSTSHIADILGSLYSISSPAILFALALLIPAVRGRVGALVPRVIDHAHAPGAASSLGAVRDPRLYILLPAVVFALLHNFALNSAIGYPFDWDLMCVLSPPLLYTAVFVIGRSGRDEQNAPSLRPAIPALLVLGLGTITLFGVNASPLRAYHRVEDMGVWLHKTYYGGSHYRLSSNLSTVADRPMQARERARVLARLMPNVYPNDWEVSFLWERLALERVSLDDYEGAKEAFESAVKVEPSKWRLLKPLGYLEAEIGDARRGIQLLKEYLAKAPADSEGWLFLGNACGRAGMLDEARASWLRFLELDPESSEAAGVREQLDEIGGASPRVTGQ